MQRYLTCTLFLFALHAFAAAPTTAPAEGSAKALFSDDFSQAQLEKQWTILRGFWKPEDGVLRGTENPKETNAHKAASLAAQDLKPFTDCIFEYDLRFDGARQHRLGLNGTEAHNPLFHIDVLRDRLDIAREPLENEKGQKATKIATTPLSLMPGEWVHVRVEIRGPTVTVQVGETKLAATHDLIGKEKGMFKLFVTGDSISFRSFRLLAIGEIAGKAG